MGMTISGDFEKYFDRLTAAGQKTPEGVKRAAYSGMSVFCNALRGAVNALPIVKRQKRRNIGVLAQERAAIAAGIGISKIEYAGNKVTVKSGFAGYTPYTTRKYTSGIPIPLLARAINRGTKNRTAIPFVKQAARTAKNSALSAIIEEFDSYILNNF